MVRAARQIFVSRLYRIVFPAADRAYLERAAMLNRMRPAAQARQSRTH
jgi:hypothetical protein